jgi:hypothetical protein
VLPLMLVVRNALVRPSLHASTTVVGQGGRWLAIGAALIRRFAS